MSKKYTVTLKITPKTVVAVSNFDSSKPITKRFERSAYGVNMAMNTVIASHLEERNIDVNFDMSSATATNGDGYVVVAEITNGANMFRIYEVEFAEKDIIKALSEEQIEFLADLTYKMKTQDNRGTAQPYALVIGQKERRITDWDVASDYMIYYDETYFDTIEEFHQTIEEEYTEDGETEKGNEIIKYMKDVCDDFDGLKYHSTRLSDLMGNIGCINVVGYDVVETFTNDHCGGNFFITDKAAKDYVEINRHNLKEPFTYGIHLYRNPEMEKLYKILGVIGETLK